MLTAFVTIILSLWAAFPVWVSDRLIRLYGRKYSVWLHKSKENSSWINSCLELLLFSLLTLSKHVGVRFCLTKQQLYYTMSDWEPWALRYLSTKLIFLRELHSTLDEICSSTVLFSAPVTYFLSYEITVGKCQRERRLTVIIRVKGFDWTTLQTMSWSSPASPYNPFCY